MQGSIKQYDATWNPWYGCHKISNGCAKCRAYAKMLSYGHKANNIMRSKEKTFNKPMLGLEGPMISVCEWSDFFIKEANAWRDEAWAIMKENDHLVFQICTRRPIALQHHLPDDWGDGYPNVWIGVSVFDNKSAKQNIPYLTEIEAVVKFVNVEPILGPVNLSPWTSEGHLNWVVCGGETGPTARLPQRQWIRNVLVNCLHDDVPFFFKGYGGNELIDGAYGGDKINGEQFHEYPINVVWKA